MHTTTIKSSFVLAVAFVVTLLMQLALTLPAHALQTAAVWDGGGTTDNFSEAANWVGDVVPSGGESIYLDTDLHPGSTTFNNDLTAGTSFESIVLVGDAGAGSTYKLTGNSVTLTSAEDADKAIKGGLINATDKYQYKTFAVELDITVAADMDFYAGGNLIIGKVGGTNTLDLSTFTMTKTGAYPLTINSTVSGTAGVTVNDGWFVADKTGNTVAVTIGNGGTLKGNGAVGNVTVQSGGTVAPGLSPGCLSTGDIAYTSGSIYVVEIDGATACTQYDQTQVTGTVTLGNATLDIQRLSTYTPADATLLTIITNDGTDAVTGTFNGLAEGATTTVDGVIYTVSYTGGDGNDVVLSATAVTAPNTGFGSATVNYMFIALFTAAAATALVVAGRKLQKVKN